MTPQEMHIQIDQALQRVGSYVYDNFEPVELDLILSKMQMRYIDDKFRKDTTSEGFQVEQGDLDDIQFLIERDKILPAFMDTTNKKTHGVLPSDYLYLINDRTRLNEDCTVANLEASTPYTDEVLFTAEFPNQLINPPYYADVDLVVGALTLYDSTYGGFPGVPDAIEKYIIKDYILDTIRQNIRENKLSGVTGIYWEHYKDTYAEESFILVTDSTRVGETFSVRVEGTTNSDVGVATSGLTVSSLTHSKEVDNRLTKSQFLHSTLNNNVYHKTHRRNPVSNLTKDRLYVYYDEKYIPTHIIIDYIRKPREISLSLNQSCELSNSTHPKIIDLSVEYLKNTIEQQSYNTKVQDNRLRSE